MWNSRTLNLASYLCSNSWVLRCQCWRFECSGTRQRVKWNTPTGVS